MSAGRFCEPASKRRAWALQGVDMVYGDKCNCQWNLESAILKSKRFDSDMLLSDHIIACNKGGKYLAHNNVVDKVNKMLREGGFVTAVEPQALLFEAGSQKRPADILAHSFFHGGKFGCFDITVRGAHGNDYKKGSVHCQGFAASKGHIAKLKAKVGKRQFSIRQRMRGVSSASSISATTYMSDAVAHLNGVLLPIAMDHDGAMDAHTIKNIQAIVLRAAANGHCAHKFRKKHFAQLGLALLRGTLACVDRLLFKRTWNTAAQDYDPKPKVRPTEMDYGGVQGMDSTRPMFISEEDSRILKWELRAGFAAQLVCPLVNAWVTPGSMHAVSNRFRS